MDILQIAKENPFSVELKRISESPGPYCMSFGFDLNPLIRSIERVGLINSPVVVLGGGGRVEVVAGYRRILALKHLQWEMAPCRDLSDALVSPLQLLLFNLQDNLGTRPFNEVEKGMILNRLALYVQRENILGEFMPLLGLPPHEPTLETFLRMQDLEHPIKESFVYTHISFETVKSFLTMDSESRCALFEWITGMSFNSNQQRQFIAYAIDISMREKKNIWELLKEEQMFRILDDKKLNNPQKIKSMLNYLKSRRFPLLTRTEKAFQKRVSDLNLPEGVRVHHPPFFEAPDYRLEILFKDGTQLKQKIDALQSMDHLEDLGDPWQEEKP